MAKIQVISLNPGMPILANPGIPSLVEEPADADKLDSVFLKIETDKPCRWVYSPGERICFLVAGTDSNRGETAILTVWDWENKPVAQTNFVIPFSTEVQMKAAGRGTYVLTLDTMKNGKCEYRLVRSFSVCPANNKKRSLWKKNGFWVGQCSFPGWQGGRAANGHFVYPPQLTEELSRQLDAELVARMGVSIARVDLPVYRKDNEGLDLDFSLSDKCIKAFVSHGLNVDLHLSIPVGPGKGPILLKYSDITDDRAILYPIKEQAYRHYIRQTVSRYGKYAKFIQVRNEPGNPYQYGGTADEFANEVKQAVEETRKVKVNALISNGGYCNVLDTTKQVIQQIKGVTDFVSYHCHGDINTLKLFFSQVKDLHNSAGYSSPQYANTEMGYYMPSVGGERTNAVAEMQKLLYCWAHGNLGVMLYSSREAWWPRQYRYDGISDYGFVDYFFCPRFVYGAVSAFLDRYAGFRFNRIMKETDNLHVYEFRSGKKSMVAVFASKEPIVVKLASNGKNATLLDPMGNETTYEKPDLVTLTAGEYPVTVVFDGATKILLLD